MALASALRRRLDRGRYLVQQWGLASATSLLMEGWHRALGRGRSPGGPSDLRWVLDRFSTLLDDDLQHVEQGLYPRDLLFQIPWRSYAQVAPQSLLEGPRVLLRRYRGKHRDLPTERIHRRPYPDYYLRNFHWQTDGWLSRRSARIYDLNVELLFAWTADIMRRMAIPPVIEAVRGLDRPPVIVDVGTGTGRYLVQLHRALPEARLIGVDLSCYYLEQARRNLAHARGVALLEENCEQLSLAENSVDAVTSVFLLHELPGDARRAMIAEAFRVLRPGGALVICDAAQPQTSPELRAYMEAFPALYHEPYFKGYLRTGIDELMRQAGFVDVTSAPRFVSQVVSGRRPG